MGIKKFFQDAFADMKESAKAQHEVDKANMSAVKAESRAQWEEAKALGDPGRRKAVMQAERDAQIRDANNRLTNCHFPVSWFLDVGGGALDAPVHLPNKCTSPWGDNPLFSFGKPRNCNAISGGLWCAAQRIKINRLPVVVLRAANQYGYACRWQAYLCQSIAH